MTTKPTLRELFQSHLDDIHQYLEQPFLRASEKVSVITAFHGLLSVQNVSEQYAPDNALDEMEVEIKEALIAIAAKDRSLGLYLESLHNSFSNPYFLSLVAEAIPSS